MDLQINQLAAKLFRLLRVMDDEATTQINGKHAGLADYAGHCGVTGNQFNLR